MKLAIVSELYYPSTGGQEVRYAQLAAELVARGHEVVIFVIGHAEGLPAEEELNGIRIRRLVDAPNYINRAGGLSRDPRVIFRFSLALLLRIVELRKFDSVIFNIWPLLPSMVCGPFLGRKAVVDWCELRSGRHWKLIYWLLALTSKKHIGVNEQIVERLKKEYGIRSDHAVAILSGIPVAEYAATADEKSREAILYFGRLSPHKNPLMLAESYLSSAAVQELAPLIFAGGGEQLAEIQALAHPKIQALGFISDAQKIHLLKTARLLVLPSRREGFPRVIAEAAAAGTPVLTVDFPDNGSVGVVRQYGIGWVCSPDAASLAKAMQQHLTNDLEWNQISTRAVEVAKQEFDWDVIVAKLLRFLSPGSR